MKWFKIFYSSNRLSIQIIFPTTIIFLTWLSQKNSFAYVWMRTKVGFFCATWPHYLGLSCLRRKKKGWANFLGEKRNWDLTFLKTLATFQWRKYLRIFQVFRILRSCKKNERVISFLFHHFIHHLYIFIHFANFFLNI